jgi:CubicO group peptidase (beta-lactamase class C family)
MKKIAISALVTLLLIGRICQAQINISAGIDSIFATNGGNSPGCAVAVIKDGQVIFTKGYGLASMEYKVPITASSIFDVASLSKQFTGFAISTLIQQGKISLNDDVRKYLPEFPKFEKPITIGNLVHHTSGLRDWPEALQAAGWRYSELCSFDDIMNMVKHQKELDFEPGSEHFYSNTGYNVLAAIIEKATGKTFSQWTSENIFKPLEMDGTFFLDDSRKVIPGLASSYYPDNGAFVKSTDILTAYGSSSLYTSVDDLAKWAIAFEKGIHVKDPVYTRMLEGTTLNNGTKISYGFGLETEDYNGYKSVVHTGAWAGYRTIIRMFPDQKAAFIVLGNANNNNLSGELTAKLINLFMEKKNIAVASTKALTVYHPATDILKRYTGNYKWGDGEVAITRDKCMLMFQYSGEDAYPIVALSDSVFLLEAANKTVTFHDAKNGAVNAFTFRDKVSKRFYIYNTPLNELYQYKGIYYSPELEAQYSVYVKGNKLYIYHFRRGEFELSSHTKDEFTGDIGSLAFYRDAKGISGFKLSGGRVRNICFNKSKEHPVN